MTPGSRDLALWGGGAWVLVVVGLGILFWRGARLSELASRDDAAYADYRKFYHPDEHVGVYVTEDEADLTKAKELQSQQLEKAEAALVPQLPDSYRLVVDRLTENESIVSQDQGILNTDAMSRGVNLAAKSPYLQLDQDPKVRAHQMAELYLYRLVLKCCIDAKVKRVSTVTVMPSTCDPTLSYQLFSCRFEVDASFESGQRLIESLSYASKLGISMSYLRITPSPADPGQRESISFVATLIIPNQTGGANARSGGT